MAKNKIEMMELPFDPSQIDGLSEELLTAHYEGNYGHIVEELNEILEKLQKIDWESAEPLDFKGLKEEEAHASNALFLHELYFSCLGGSGEPTGELAAALKRDFGSVKKWKMEFVACAKALKGDHGWVSLSFSPRAGKLCTLIATDYTQAPIEGGVIIPLDMYEHSYHLDFGPEAEKYVDAFMRNVDWEQVNERFMQVMAELHQGDGSASPAVKAYNEPRARMTRSHRSQRSLQ